MEEGKATAVLRLADSQMKKAVEALGRELMTLRSGRATPALVENLRVDYHGIPTPLNQIASIMVPEARLVVIQPWDRSSLGNIEKAILKSDLGLNPSNDGHVLRLVIPPLSEERRRSLVKVVRQRLEESRVELRNLRRGALEELRKQEKDKQISADEQKRAADKLQALVDSFIDEVNRLGQAKEAELLEI